MRLAAAGCLALAAAGAARATSAGPALPCATQATAGLPFCNASLPFTERIADLISRINSTDKVNLLTNSAASVPYLGLPSYQWWSEALHGVADSPGVTFNSVVPGATSFPQVTTSAASFNTSLWQAIATAISTEARAMNNVGQAGLTFWTPNINIVRDPRWGRGQETPGECPLLSSQYVNSFVRGFQEGDDPRFLKASAACKHYAAYSLENWNGTSRDYFNAVVTDQDLADTYLVAFQACASDARSSGMMCSYNEVNGVPSCADSFLLTTLFREAWGFEGYVTSDCGAISDVYYTHKYENSTDATCAAVLTSGMDIGCDDFLPLHADQALADGSIDSSDLDEALTNLFSVQFRLGLFDPPQQQPYRSIGLDQICTPEHTALAQDAAQQGFVLLRNSGALPLNATLLRSIAVVGPNADATTTMQANYYGQPCGPIVSPQQALQAIAPVTYAQGCSIAGTDTSGFQAAIQAASSSDATILVMGLDQSQEAEGLDRTSIGLPGVQASLIQQVCAAAAGPCVLVIMSGSSVDISAQLADYNVDAILWIGYPGEAGGLALAATLTGASVPAGALPVTWYFASYTSQVSMFEMNMRPGPSVWPPFSSPGRTFRFYQGEAVAPFGAGLSYSRFSYTFPEGGAPATVSLKHSREYLAANPNHGGRFGPLSSSAASTLVVNVTNEGPFDADHVVLGFLSAPGAGTGGVPLQDLFGFQRVHVAVGETVTVWLPLTARDLTLVTADGQRVALSGRYSVRIGTGWGGAPTLAHAFEAA